MAASGRRGDVAVLWDYDGTLSNAEGIVVLGELWGVGREVGEITRAAMAGEIPFAEAMEMRICLLHGFPEERLAEARGRVHLRPGAKETLHNLRVYGLGLAVVTGGFEQLIGPSLPPYVSLHANRLLFEDGELANVEMRVDKGPIAARYARAGKIAAVGDGSTDIEMFTYADFSIAMGEKEGVVRAADLFARDVPEAGRLILEKYACLDLAGHA